MSDGGPDASDGFDPRRWLTSLTYEEIHAIVPGVAIFCLSAVAASVALLSSGLALLLWAWGIRISPYRDTRTGDRKTIAELEDVAADESSDGKLSGMVAKYLVQIRHEPHYFTAGAVAGDGLGRLGHYWLFGTWPTHYEKLPEIIEALVPIAPALL